MLINILVIFTLLMLYAFYKSKFERTQCIDLIFFAMWVCFAVEYYATTDYNVYYENFDRTYIHVIWEPGYRLLLLLFQPFGFFVFNAVVAAFEMYTLCYMFKRFSPPGYMWIG
ncbi:MAG: EpsG family protein, partial [Muribaculum sp.]|nr:EpsG family protein [Muribaculum sp.]